MDAVRSVIVALRREDTNHRTCSCKSMPFNLTRDKVNNKYLRGFRRPAHADKSASDKHVCCSQSRAAENLDRNEWNALRTDHLLYPTEPNKNVHLRCPRKNSLVLSCDDVILVTLLCVILSLRKIAMFEPCIRGLE